MEPIAEVSSSPAGAFKSSPSDPGKYPVDNGGPNLPGAEGARAPAHPEILDSGDIRHPEPGPPPSGITAELSGPLSRVGDQLGGGAREGQRGGEAAGDADRGAHPYTLEQNLYFADRRGSARKRAVLGVEPSGGEVPKRARAHAEDPGA